MKSKLKILSTIILASIIVLNMSLVQVVRAEAKKAEPTNDTLKLIPDTITLNVKESEFLDDKCDEEQERVLNSIENTLRNAGVDLTNSDLYILFGEYKEYGMELNDIHTADIVISNLYDDSKELTKRVKVKYSNSSDYNATDEKTVKDIANIFQNCWTAYDFDEEIPDIDESFENFMADYITDKSITYEYHNPFGMGVNIFTEYTYMQTLFFKNDICYAAKLIPYQTNRMITIPENIKDTEQDYINYAMPIVKNEMVDWIDDFKLEKEKDNGNWYDILVKDDETNQYEVYDWILIKKESTPLEELGDINYDGKIDAQDAVQILKYVAHNIELTNSQLSLADTNKDGTVDAQDAVQILKYVAHNIERF